MFDVMLDASRCLLEIVCDDLQCYGEVYQCNQKKDEVVFQMTASYFTQKHEPSNEVLRFSQVPNTEMYRLGQGVVGTCVEKNEFEVRVIENLLEDLHLFDQGGTRLAAAGEVFSTVITVPVYGATHNAVGNNVASVLVFYLSNDVSLLKLDQLQTYLTSFVTLIDPMVRFMAHRRVLVPPTVHQHPASITAIVPGTGTATATKSAVGLLGLEEEESTVADCECGCACTTEECPPSSVKHAVNLPYGVLSIADLSATDMENEIEAFSHDISSIAETLRFRKSDSDHPQQVAVTKTAIWEWLISYFLKWKGTNATQPVPLKPKYCAMTWLGSFTAYLVIQLIYDKINYSFVVHGHTDVFVLPAYFGALSVLVYALPAAPLCQPRIIYLSHSYAIAVSVVLIYIFEQHQLVYLQQALAIAFTASGMARFGFLNPPAGALSVGFIGYYNSATYSETGLLFLIVSVYIACTLIILIGMVLHNVTKGRSYPINW
jgi:CBS domain-containing membrane protein